MNFKRRRPKHQRAGCLLCKPWKDERAKRSRGKVDRKRSREMTDREHIDEQS